MDNYFDNTISIAVIHHLDNSNKRVDAINEMFRVTNMVELYSYMFGHSINH